MWNSDTPDVHLVPQSPLDSIDRVLVSLPTPMALATGAEARLVIGANGAFVVLDGGIDVSRAAERASDLAATTRSALACHLSWIPFVDAVVVADTEPDLRRRATVVPFDLLPEVLREGPSVIDPGILEAVSDLLLTDRLPGWTVGIGAGSARIDLCDDLTDHAAPAVADRRD